MQSTMNLGYWKPVLKIEIVLWNILVFQNVHTLVMKDKVYTSPDCWKREVAVNKQENKLTAHIICKLVTPYSVNKAFCQLLVKLSKVIYAPRSTIPEKVVALSKKIWIFQ